MHERMNGVTGVCVCSLTLIFHVAAFAHLLIQISRAFRRPEIYHCVTQCYNPNIDSTIA
jgi:hypothetical protein